MPKIGVAAVNGPAAGAGFTLAAACDLRIAAASARFSTSFATVGLSGDMGGSHTLPRLLGPTLARDLYLPRHSVDAQEALPICLVSGNAAHHDTLAPAETEPAAGRARGGPSG